MKQKAMFWGRLLTYVLFLMIVCSFIWAYFQLITVPAPEITESYCDSMQAQFQAMHASTNTYGGLILPPPKDCYAQFPERYCPYAVAHTNVGNLLAICLQFVPK